MKAQEFRIGNLVDVINRSGMVHFPTGIELRIIAVGMFSVQCVPNEIETHRATSDVIMTIPISDLCPINITEERLVRLGFVVNESATTKYVYKHITPTCYISFLMHSDNVYLCIEPGVDDPESDECCEQLDIKQVHQLQNLVFDLTGEELTTTPIQ